MGLISPMGFKDYHFTDCSSPEGSREGCPYKLLLYHPRSILAEPMRVCHS
jgi:hypothetical protein